jgi:hexosaminidase
MTGYHLTTVGAIALALAACRQPAAPAPDVRSASAARPPAVLPFPQTVALTGGTLPLPRTLACHVADTALRPLVGVLDGEYRMLTGGSVVAAPAAAEAPCRLAVDPKLGAEEYRLDVDSAVRLAGGSYEAVALGSVTLLQMLERGAADGAAVPKGAITDRPSMPFRGLLVDLGREWHDVSNLEQLVELARWYKINYLQLHLTDDQLFTFPTRAYPDLPTPGRHYTVEELRALDEFARARGVTLIPEFEVPGHSGVSIAHRPDIFGFAGRREARSTINMGREAAYAAIDTIMGEIADVFRTSPYIHIGGDEASLEGLAEDSDVRRYMAAHDLPDVNELYRHFLVRMNETVKRHGKRMIVWEGFAKEGRVQIPREVLVMAWETVYQLPQDLLAGGYTVLNVSWKPLYVAMEKKWPVEYIYDRWNLYRWENWVPRMPSFTPIQLDSTPRVIGSMMASWLQPEHIELPTLRRRLAALSERTWNAAMQPERPFAWFAPTLERTDSALQAVLSPVTVDARGLRFPGLEDGHYGEPYWFDDTLTVVLRAPGRLVVRYTLDGTKPTARSSPYAEPITLATTTHLRARAFTPAGEAVGYDRWFEYQLHPLRAEVIGELRPPLSALWEMISDTAHFSRPVTIRLSSVRRGSIRYTLDGSAPSPAASEYRGPITLTSTAAVRAQLFTAAGDSVGPEWSQRFARQ